MFDFKKIYFKQTFGDVKITNHCNEGVCTINSYLYVEFLKEKLM